MPQARGQLVAIIGAECSGKTSLALALGRELPADVVPEQLRLFVARHGRAPLAGEQAQLMAAQIDAEDRAATTGWLVSDSGALMTAVYSLLYYDDPSLVEAAAARHRVAYRLTVWCGIEIPWRADPGVRDGPKHRERCHAVIGRVVRDYELPVLLVQGSLPDRAAAVVEALAGGSPAVPLPEN